jgi:hypothetical protein
MKLCFCLTKSPRNTGRGWKFSGWQPWWLSSWIS